MECSASTGEELRGYELGDALLTPAPDEMAEPAHGDCYGQGQ